jgi:hypothetical protein
MRRLPLAALTVLALALAGPASADDHRPPPLPPAVPGPIEPDAAALPSVSADSVGAVSGPHRYRLLREGDAQCRAVATSSVANMLDRERQQMMVDHPPCPKFAGDPPPKGAKAWNLRRAVLYYAALDDRNRSAGIALALYFRAAELEAQLGLLQLSHDELTGAVKKSDELQKKGFHLPIDPGSLKRQLLDVEADQTRARAGLAEINSRLKVQIGVTDLAADEWLWPAIEMRVVYEPVDAEAAVAVAMHKRPELLLLRALSHDSDASTVPVVREYLHSVSGLIGASAGPVKCIVATLLAFKSMFGCGENGEKDLRDGQVSDLLAERERAVAEEVRRAVADLNAKSRIVALSRDRVLSAEEHRRDAEQAAERASGSFLEVLKARLDWYKARGQLTTDVMAWHIARAKVREAQGVFVWECCKHE